MTLAGNKKTVYASQSCPVKFCTPSQARALLCEGKGRTLVLLVRHGTTEWNIQAKLQGREEIPLNSLGRQQANELAACLADVLSAENGEAVVFTSPLLRAKDTASMIANEAGLGEPTVVEGLIEREYGSMTGMTFAQRCKRFRSGKEACSDMESVEDATVRMKRTVGSIRRSTKARCVVAVTHGGVMNSLFSCITRGRAGCSGNITLNCTVSPVAVGDRDVIPLAFNLSGEEASKYISEIIQNG